LRSKPYCGKYLWVPLLGIIGYISYDPPMVARELGSQQCIPRTLGSDQCGKSFKDIASSSMIAQTRKHGIFRE